MWQGWVLEPKPPSKDMLCDSSCQTVSLLFIFPVTLWVFIIAVYRLERLVSKRAGNWPNLHEQWVTKLRLTVEWTAERHTEAFHTWPVLVRRGEGGTWCPQRMQKSWCCLTIITSFFFPLHSLLNFFSFLHSEHNDPYIGIISRYIFSSFYKSMRMMLKEGRMGATLKWLGILCLYYLDLEGRTVGNQHPIYSQTKDLKNATFSISCRCHVTKLSPDLLGPNTHLGNGDYWLNFLFGKRVPCTRPLRLGGWALPIFSVREFQPCLNYMAGHPEPTWTEVKTESNATEYL